LPQRPVHADVRRLARLVLAHRQLREFEQAAAFERVLAKVDRTAAAEMSPR